MLEDARRIIKILAMKGFESYLVGGCVRDSLMKRPISDIDIATAARPGEVMEIFSKNDIYAVPTGFEHGTITVVINGANFEITTFRKDISTDGRRSTVEFGASLEEDLLRRDFTINAIAYHPEEKRYIDPYGGMKDIKDGIIRAVGTPIDRFREDYLRMIRAHRFESALEFALDAPTREALMRAAAEEWEAVISVERIRDEINKCFRQAERPSIMFEGMRKSCILKKVLPELSVCFGFEQNKYHEFDLYYHTLMTIDAVPRGRYLVRWSALFHDLGKIDACENHGPDSTFYGHEKVSAKMARNIMRRFKFSNRETAYVVNLVKYHMYNYTEEMKDSSVRRLVASVGEENIEDLCLLRYADGIGKVREPLVSGNRAGSLIKRIERMSAEEKVFKIKDLAISGREVMEIKKIPSSRKVGEVLRALYEIVLEDPSRNTNERLRSIVAEM